MGRGSMTEEKAGELYRKLKSFYAYRVGGKMEWNPGVAWEPTFQQFLEQNKRWEETYAQAYSKTVLEYFLYGGLSYLRDYPEYHYRPFRQSSRYHRVYHNLSEVWASDKKGSLPSDEQRGTTFSPESDGSDVEQSESREGNDASGSQRYPWMERRRK
jgi:hypothetical protein